MGPYLKFYLFVHVDVKYKFDGIFQEPKSSVKDESVNTSKSNVPLRSTPSAAGPVTEDEIRAVLMQKAPVTTQDLVAKFKARLKSQEVCCFPFSSTLGSLNPMLPGAWVAMVCGAGSTQFSRNWG